MSAYASTEDILHILITYHITDCHSCRHMVPLVSSPITMNIMSVYMSTLCEAGYLLHCGLDCDDKMGEKIIQPPTNNVDYNKTQ